jgi:soluble lytic murein transglycosylase
MLTCLALGLAATGPACALNADDIATYKQAFKAANQGKIEDAKRIAKRARDDVAEKVIRWLDLTQASTSADWNDITGFMQRNPDWPNMAALRRNAEARMPASLSYQEVRSWFETYPPLTLAGFDRYIVSLMETKSSDKAIALVRKRYVEGTFGSVEERDFRQRYNGLLRPADHAARLDRLLWDGNYDEAARVMSIASPGQRAVAEARIALSTMSAGVDGALRRVPADLQNDPGLAYERAKWRRRKDMDEAALEIVAKPPAEADHGSEWWVERHILARRLIEQGKFARAYDLVAGHKAKDGLAFAQAEFLAGWLALRQLNRPDEAQKHFEALFRGTTSPISKSRGAYWAGRAVEALGNKELARTWYDAAMSYSGTFYGLLAADKLGLPAGSALPAPVKVPVELQKGFQKLELVRVVQALARIEGADSDRVTLFLRKMAADAKTAETYEMVGKLALEIGRPDLGVTTSRTALQNGFVLADAGFPLLPHKLNALPEAGLVHGIIRQESNFNRLAVSSAGARGLMQVMPATAKAVAKQQGLRHSDDKLTAEPKHNVAIGSAYLQEVLDRYGGSYVLAIASYNAGPGRVSGWLNTFGDPRSPNVDVVDWIETMPIYETRNYVQRVLENLHLYRARLGLPPISMTNDLARGSGGQG